MPRGTTSAIRGHLRADAIRDLALDAVPRTELAEKYGVAYPTLYKFSQDYSAEIELVRQALVKGVADNAGEIGLWIADKQQRLWEYQQDVEDINGVIAKYGDAALDPKLLTAKHRAIHSAAEELAQLPVRAQVESSGSQIVYTVEGIADPKAALT